MLLLANLLTVKAAEVV